jgi:hypothetical protein
MAAVAPLAQPAPPTGVSQQELDERWDQLLAEADAAWLAYMQQRTPKDLQPHLAWYVEQHQAPVEPPPPDPNVATVMNGASIAIRGPGNTMIPVTPGTAFVSNSLLDRVEVSPASSAALITNGTSVNVIDAASVPVAGSPGAANVSAGAVQSVRLTV